MYELTNADRAEADEDPIIPQADQPVRAWAPDIEEQDVPEDVASATELGVYSPLMLAL